MKSGRINIDLIRETRDQLWAEAVVLYEAGESWWITKKETLADAERHQRDRYIGDPWDEAIGGYIDLHSEVTIDDVLRGALHLEIGRCGQLEMNRVARSLRALAVTGFKPEPSGGKRVWKYRKPHRGRYERHYIWKNGEGIMSKRVSPQGAPEEQTGARHHCHH